MTKIKKSIWSAVIGLVMCFALVFGVVAGANSNKVANAESSAESTEFVALMQCYFIPGSYDTYMLVDKTEIPFEINNVPVANYTRLQAYGRAIELAGLISEEENVGMVTVGYNWLDTVTRTIFDAPNAVINTINNTLGVYISDSEKYETATQYYDAASFHYATYDENGNITGYVDSVDGLKTSITYNESTLVEDANAAYEALDTYQKQYVDWKTNGLYNKKAANEALRTMEGYLQNVINGSLELYPQAVAGVYYSYKTAYETIVENYNKLDPAAQAGTEISNSLYPDIVGLNEVFEDIEEKATEAKTAIENMEYYFDGEMVKSPNGEVVVDTQASFDAATEALNGIYNGRTVNGFKVANCKITDLSDVENAALATYLTELGRYNDAASILAGYKAEAELVEADIVDLNVTADDHYKVAEVEESINAVYADYEALNVDGYNGHNNKQIYIAPANRDKIEGYKTTLDTLNAWIKEVAKLADKTLADNAPVADVDGVIKSVLEEYDTNGTLVFDIDDKDAVEALITEYNEVLVADSDEAKVNALADARRVLDLLKEKIDEAIAEEAARVERLEELLEEMGNVLTNGVKYADKVLVDEFDEIFAQISRTSQEAVKNNENYKNYEALKEALNVILNRAENLGEAIASIEYRHETDNGYVMNTEAENGEIVVASKESVEAAQELVAAVYNGDALTAQNGVEYKIAGLTYPWAEDVVETADGNVNAFVYYFGDEVAEYFEKYDKAVEDLEALKAEAANYQTKVNAFELTKTNNYKVQETTIEELYAEYQGLDHGTYNNVQDWVDAVKVTDAHDVLVELNRWILTVAVAIDSESALDETKGADYVIAEAKAGRTPVELTLAQIETLLNAYNNVTAGDEIKEESVKDAHDLLVARQEAIEKEAEELQKELDALEDLLNDGVKYSDKEKYDELVERLENLDPDADVDSTNLDTLGEALDEIEKRIVGEPTHASGLKNAFDNIVYRHGNGDTEPYEVNTVAENGEIVVYSKESVEAAQALVEAVYNGDELTASNGKDYKIAYLTYENWSEDTVDGENAFVHYNLLTAEDYAKYESAVEDLEVLKEEARIYQNKVNAFELTKTNNYKVQETTIEELYAEYQGLDHGTYNNVQDWVDAVKVTDAKEVLDLLNGWVDAVARAIDSYNDPRTLNADSTVADVDAFIANTTAEDVKLTLEEIEGLLANYEVVTAGDEIKEESVKDAYNLLVNRQQEIEEAAEKLQEKLDNLSTTDIKYSVKDEYEELKKAAEELEALGAELDTENLETVGEALETIEERTQALKTAIDNIEYYLDGEMVKDSNGEVVYDTKTSLEEATAKVEAVYDGTANIAELTFPWDATEVEALDKWSELTGITAEDLEKYSTALENFEELKTVAETVAEDINDLVLDETNHYKAQEEEINSLYNRYVALSHESETETYNNHNDWTQHAPVAAQSEKIENVKETLDTINGFILEVATLVDETATAETADEVISNALENGFEKEFSFDYNRVVELLDEYNDLTDDQTEEYYNAKVAALKPAKDVLDAMYNRMKEINNDLADKILDIIARKENLVEADYDTIMNVKETYEKLSDKQKEILAADLENDYPELFEDDWKSIYPHTIDEFLDLANKFQFALYFKQAVDELVEELDTTYFTVEGYVLEKALLSMYCNFDPAMQAMVESSYQNLLRIDAAYKEVNRDEYTSYTTVTEELQDKIDDAKTDLEAAQAALEADIIEALGQEGVETVKEALVAYKTAVAKAQDDLEAAQTALVNEITNSLDPEAESVEKAFETYKDAVAKAQDDLEAAQAELVTEIKTALGDEEAESVQAALEKYKTNVEESQAEAAKASEEGNKENDEKVEKLKKALIITAVVGGVVAVAAVACIIALFAKMSALGGAAASSSAAGSAAAGSAGAEGGKEE